MSLVASSRLVNRELVPWIPDDDGTALEDLTLTSQSKKGGHWDQFAVNKAQFGVQTSFDEDASLLFHNPQTSLRDPPLSNG